MYDRYCLCGECYASHYSFTLIALFLLSLSPTTSALAASDRYVSTTGSNSGDCAVSACLTIAYAITQSTSRDTINIAAGTYTESGLDVSGKGTLTFIGAGTTSTFVQAAASAGIASDRVFKINILIRQRRRPVCGLRRSGATSTHALFAASPARDVIPSGVNDCGNSPFDRDQRGGTRPVNGNFSTGELYTIDKSAPTAGSLVAPDVTTGGGTTYTFTVTFSDNLAIDSTSIDGNDIRVSGPGSFNQFATLVSVAPAGNGAIRTATYQITAPGGAWDTADSGTYTIAVEANQIFDNAGNSVDATSVGSFLVSLKYTTYLPLVRS